MDLAKNDNKWDPSYTILVTLTQYLNWINKLKCLYLSRSILIYNYNDSSILYTHKTIKKILFLLHIQNTK